LRIEPVDDTTKALLRQGAGEEKHEVHKADTISAVTS
jgi:hypothetical protein